MKKMPWIGFAFGLLMTPLVYWLLGFEFRRGPDLGTMVCMAPLMGMCCFCFFKVLG